MGENCIRRIEYPDRARVAALWTGLFELHERLGAPSPLAGNPRQLPGRILEWVDMTIAGDGHFGFVFESTGDIDGFIAGAIRARPWLAAEHVGEISALWVEPDRRGQGVGGRLVRTAVAWLRENSVSFVELRVLSCNTYGREFWTSCGFTDLAVQLGRAIDR